MSILGTEHPAFRDVSWPGARTDDPGAGPAVEVRPIDPADHAAFAEAGSHSILQTPAWAGVKAGWQAQSLGWFHGERLTGTALVLYRRVPGTRRSLAYVPEGPYLPWAQVSAAPAAWLDPFIAVLRAQGAFAVRIGPQLVTRRWRPEAVKRGLAAPDVRHFADLAPDEQHPAGVRLAAVLRARGWKPVAGDRDSGFGASQPNLTVRIPLAERSEADLLAAANQQWRRNIRRAERAGVVVREGNIDDLPAFHRLYTQTAARDGFTPRPAGYFARMWSALNGTGRPALTLYVAELATPSESDGGPRPLAAALIIRSGGVSVYVYGASSSSHRQAQASTAVQWRAIRDARACGITTYDLRGVADTLDPTVPISGLLRFKLGTGGICTQTPGEWELVLSRLWHKGFEAGLRILRIRS